MKKHILASIIFLTLWPLLTLCPMPATALNSQTGTTLGAPLKLGLGARAAGMADAFVGVADDASAVLWNPAGLTQIDAFQYLGMYSSWLQGIGYSALALANPVEGSGVGGLSISYLRVDGLEETTRDNPKGTGKKFGADNLNLGLSCAYKVSPALSLGWTLKVLLETIGESSFQAASLDLGGLYSSTIPGLSLGLNLQNIGHTNDRSAFPIALNIGLGYRVRKELTLAVDAHLPSDNQPTYHLGAEYSYRGILTGRIGYNTRQEEGAGGNLSAGLGLRWEGFGLDYAYVPYGDLGNTHRLSMTL